MAVRFSCGLCGGTHPWTQKRSIAFPCSGPRVTAPRLKWPYYFFCSFQAFHTTLLNESHGAMPMPAAFSSFKHEQFLRCNTSMNYRDEHTRRFPRPTKNVTTAQFLRKPWTLTSKLTASYNAERGRETWFATALEKSRKCNIIFQHENNMAGTLLVYGDMPAMYPSCTQCDVNQYFCHVAQITFLFLTRRKHSCHVEKLAFSLWHGGNIFAVRPKWHLFV